MFVGKAPAASRTKPRDRVERYFLQTSRVVRERRRRCGGLFAARRVRDASLSCTVIAAALHAVVAVEDPHGGEIQPEGRGIPDAPSD
jgi:hypothetical protein